MTLRYVQTTVNYKTKLFLSNFALLLLKTNFVIKKSECEAREESNNILKLVACHISYLLTCRHHWLLTLVHSLLWTLPHFSATILVIVARAAWRKRTSQTTTYNSTKRYEILVKSKELLNLQEWKLMQRNLNNQAICGRTILVVGD